MGFGSEFRNMRSAGGAPKITDEAATEALAAAAEKDKAIPAPPDDADAALTAQMEEALSNKPAKEAAAPEASEPPVIPPPKPETKAKVKIKGKEFDSVEEAMAFAEAEVAEAEKKAAYAQGVQDSLKPKEEAKPEPKKIKKIAEKLFEDPEAAMEELESYILEMAEKRVETREQKKTAEQIRAEKIKEETDNFYKNNADLADWQDEVNLVVQKNWTQLSKLPDAKTIAEETARLAREYVASVKVKALPKQELPSKSAQSASGSKPSTATETPATEKKLSFAAQVRSTNKRTVMQDDA
jgi:hypothetical protein